MDSALTIINASQPWLVLNLSELFAYRELLYFFVWRDIKVRYKQTVIGAGWAVIQPFMTMVVFTLFFGRLAKVPSGGLPYPVFYYVALLPWMYFSNALTAATNTVVENQRIITKVFFPRLILPISSILPGLVDFGIAFLVLVGMMVYYKIHLTAAVFWFPFFLLLAMATALGVGLWLSALNALYRDIKYVLPFLIQFWMFASPVAYPSSLVPERWRWVYGLNPMAGVIDGFRWSLTGQAFPSMTLISVSTIAVLILLAGGLFFFQKIQGTIVDLV